MNVCAQQLENFSLKYDQIAIQIEYIETPRCAPLTIIRVARKRLGARFACSFVHVLCSDKCHK